MLSLLFKTVIIVPLFSLLKTADAGPYSLAVGYINVCYIQIKRPYKTKGNFNEKCIWRTTPLFDMKKGRVENTLKTRLKTPIRARARDLNLKFYFG